MADAGIKTRTLAAVRQAPDLLTRKTRKTISRGMPSDLDSAAAASSSPASAQAHTGGVGHHSITATAIMTSNAKSVSLIMKCSSWMAYADSRTGTIAAAATQPGHPVRLSNA